jgi:hypothetical protein
VQHQTPTAPSAGRGPADELLAGGTSPDLLAGHAGNDTIFGHRAGDTVRGGPGQDELHGGAGDDSIGGGADADTLQGSDGADTLYGRGSDDRISGGAGDDQILGGKGDDTIIGGDGNDTISGGAGDDLINAGPGTDTVVLGPPGGTYQLCHGSDARGAYVVVHGPRGTDTIYGAEKLVLEDGQPVDTEHHCFYAGTLIRTPGGEVPVETLRPGDLVLTAEGGPAPVRWVGRQTVSTRFADPLRALPIRIRAGALAEGIPARDLLLSPGHALRLGGVLVQAGALVNGTSILRERAVPEVFTYWHIELAEHALVFAEGAEAESFVDVVSHDAFDNWAEHALLKGEADTCVPEMDLPRARSHRQVPRAVRSALAARAEALCGPAAAGTVAAAAA